MKVLGLCSGRVHGNTEMMMKEAFMAIEEKIPGVECELIRIQETEIKTCIQGNLRWKPWPTEHFVY